jgi:hypothetical protein
MDGEEWKNEESDWDTLERAATYEFSSIVKGVYETVLRPVVQRGQSVDRDALDMISSDLEWKTEEDSFEKLPFNIKNAYQSLKNFVDTMRDTDDITIAEQKDVLEGNFLLGICCTSYGDNMKLIYVGRNPCRENQIEMYSALAKARRNSEQKGVSLPLLEASGQMYDVCKKCPFK